MMHPNLPATDPMLMASIQQPARMQRVKAATHAAESDPSGAESAGVRLAGSAPSNGDDNTARSDQTGEEQLAIDKQSQLAMQQLEKYRSGMRQTIVMQSFISLAIFCFGLVSPFAGFAPITFGRGPRI
jgi:hypothetical protein